MFRHNVRPQFREPAGKILACTLIAITIPCAAQMSMVVGLVARYGTAYLAVILLPLFIWAVLVYS